jgi:geranylgeranyl pyrophosphate synthase
MMPHYNRNDLDIYIKDLLNNMKDSKLKEAIHYSIFCGGKRIRPFLMINTAEVLSCENEEIYKLAAIFEIMHCATLIDDDHPSVDNSSIRRGVETTHIKYGDDIALFAGSSMLVYGLGAISKLNIEDSKKVSLLNTLSNTFGPNRCYYGQTLDVLATSHKMDLDYINEMHIEKTGSLIEGAIECAIIFSGCTDINKINNLREIGKDLGLLFQIHNDILDYEGYDGRFQEDIANNKLSTYTNSLSLDQAKEYRNKLNEKIQNQVKENLDNYNNFSKMVDFITYRKY